MNAARWAIISALVLAALLFLSREQLREDYEMASLALAKSPQRAFDLGEEHFNDDHPELYNIDLAEYFFWKAQALGSDDPYLYHEIARISFLRGKYERALTQIDLQILKHGDSTPNSYYVRALIEGFKGDYAAAAKDYGHFLKFDPHDWAAINDYAWVLLKANKPREAAKITGDALVEFPDNAWLLNSNAIALYEIGELAKAKLIVQRAFEATQKLTSYDWTHAYPGNDPRIAQEGLAAFKDAAAKNMRTITEATSTPQH